MLAWIIGGVILAVGATLITVIWWRVGDQWADDEYKKFGHGGGRARAENNSRPTVINTNEPRSNANPDP